MQKKFTLIELLVVTAQFLCDFARKTITVFADAKNVITRKFLERIEGVRGRKGEPFSKKVSLPASFSTKTKKSPAGTGDDQNHMQGEKSFVAHRAPTRGRA